MTDLDKQAQEYAEEAMRGHGIAPFEREEMLFAIRQAYKTGWIDRDKPSVEPERIEALRAWDVPIDLARCSPSQLRFLSELGYSVGDEISKKGQTNDCRYFSEGKCCLTEDSLYCVRDCCTAYSPKAGLEMAQTSKMKSEIPTNQTLK